MQRKNRNIFAVALLLIAIHHSPLPYFFHVLSFANSDPIPSKSRKDRAHDEEIVSGLWHTQEHTIRQHYLMPVIIKEKADSNEDLHSLR
jgi:hypothetical protein